MERISEVFNIDCMVGMAQYPDKYFDLAVVDPPYSETFNTDACANNKAKKGKYNIETLNGYKPTDEYWKELFRVSKNQIIWGANWYGKYFGVGGICWFKDNTGNYSPCEYAYQSLNNHVNFYQYRWNGMLQQDMKDKEIRIHPTQKPTALYSWIYKNYLPEGGKVIDTHLGSGSNRIAATKAGNIDFTGYELDNDYFDAMEKRYKDFKSQTVMEFV